jgi:hypothetical protein
MSTTSGAGGGGRIALGVVLVLVGLVWLATSVGAVEVDWAVVLPAALVLVGLGVLATSRTGGSGPLVALGVVLTILAVVSALTAPALSPRVLSGGIGDQDVRPAAGEDSAEFELGIGELTVDLRDLDEVPREVDASVGIGSLVVLVPEDVDVELDATVGAGEISALGAERDGVGASLRQTFPAEGRSTGTVALAAAVTLGQVEVRR